MNTKQKSAQAGFAEQRRALAGLPELAVDLPAAPSEIASPPAKKKPAAKKKPTKAKR